MSNRALKAGAVFCAGVFGVYIVGCDGITGPPTEFGNAELIYEYVSGSVSYFYLADVSRDGNTYLIWAYISSTFDPALLLLEPETDDLKLISSGAEWTFYSPKLSPDKNNVVFTELSGIYVVNVETGEPRLIYGQGLAPMSTQWIDNDTVLIYVAEGGWEVKTVNVNTLEANTLLSVDTSTVDYVYLSPDGKYLFVKGGIQEGDEFNPLRNFFRIYDTETWEYDEYRPENYYPSGPWSPDGTKIAIGVTNSQRTHLGYFDVATSEQIMVFSSYKLLFNPAYEVIWSADGKILGSEDRDDNVLRVFAVDVE
jgi:Tol biopolymer transport system component